MNINPMKLEKSATDVHSLPLVSTLIILLTVIVSPIECLCQDIAPALHPARPVLGKPMPDITLSNVDYYPTNKITLKDFPAKWVVLDFWISYCSSCTNSFAEISRLQRTFRDKVQFIMVGAYGKRSDSFESTKGLFQRMKDKLGLDLVVAYDSVLANHWGIGSMPRIFIIDDKGIVRVADGHVLSETKLKALMNGEEVSFRIAKEAKSYKPDQFFTFERNDSDSSSLLFGSVISRNNGERSYHPPLELETLNGKSVFVIQAASLSTLYRYAFFGKYGWYSENDPMYGRVFPEPVLETRDSLEFFQTYVPDVGYTNLYNYSIHTGASGHHTKETLMNAMQRDLEKTFGYEVAFTKRRMPCWKLVVLSRRKAKLLKTNGGKAVTATATAAGFTVKNVPVDYLLATIAGYHWSKDRRPYLNYTKIKGNIDITMDVLMTDYPAVIRALNSNGLHLLQGRKKMEIMIIRDPRAKVRQRRGSTKNWQR